jgi:hypothetical protein
MSAMPRFRRLKSLAHNVAHSFLSPLNHVDGEYVAAELFASARRVGASHVTIDFLDASVEPAAVATPRLTKSILATREDLPRRADFEDCDFQAISSLVLDVEFHFDRTRMSEHAPGLELPSYDARVTLTDSRGASHISSIREWWRY